MHEYTQKFPKISQTNQFYILQEVTLDTELRKYPLLSSFLEFIHKTFEIHLWVVAPAFKFIPL